MLFGLDKKTAIYLGSLVVLSLLMIILALGPCSRPAPKPVAPQPTAVSLRTEVELLPAANTVIQLRLTPEPAPTAEPTPQGGGFRKIVFSSNREGDRYLQIYIMDADGKNVERLTFSRSFDRDPHISYDGRYIAFSSNRADSIYQIFILDIQTKAVQQITTGTQDKRNPVWSLDNQRILFTLHTGRSAQLGIMDRDGSGIQQVTSSYGDNYGYSFTPDGENLAYASSQNNRNEIFLLNLAKRESRLLFKTDDTSELGKPMISPKGKLLVFTSDVITHKVRQIYLYDMETNQYHRITEQETDHNDPFISPDGTKIAFTALWKNAWNIFSMDLDGKNVRNLTHSPYDHYSPTWR